MSALIIHFLNVGHGDCTFVEFPSGRLMMVDINNSKSLPEEDEVALAEMRGLSLSQFKSAQFGEAFGGFINKSWESHYQSLLVDPLDYYRNHFDGRSIFRYVQTHPDMDHMSGLHRFFWQDEVPLVNFWDTANEKEVSEEECVRSPYNHLDWLVYTLLRSGVGPNDSTVKVLEKYRESSGDFWTDDSVAVLSPTRELIAAGNSSSKWNDMSYVLKLSHGGRSVVLAGDAEVAAWQSISDHYMSTELDCDILKAAHHGRLSGFSAEAIDLMAPEIVICSVGKKPTTDASALYARHGSQVLSTRFNGTIKVTIWHDGEVWIENSKSERIGSLPPI